MIHRVAVILVNWNGVQDTLECLGSLHKMKHDPYEVKVIIVDNGSTDGSVESIHTKFPDVDIVELGTNRGFAGGNNAGIQYARSLRADVLWFLNNDTEVDVKALSFIPSLSKPHIGAVGSKIYFSPGSEYHASRYPKYEKGKVIWYAGGDIDWHNMYASHHGVDEVDRGQYDKPYQTQYITGCSFAVRTDVLNVVGDFDERLYLYYEDVDLSIRIQRAGYHTMYEPSSIIWHKNASSSGKPGSIMHRYYMTRNRLFVGLKYAPIRTKAALLREAIMMYFNHPGVERRAVVDALLGRLGRWEYET